MICMNSDQILCMHSACDKTKGSMVLVCELPLLCGAVHSVFECVMAK